MSNFVFHLGKIRDFRPVAFGRTSTHGGPPENHPPLAGCLALSWCVEVVPVSPTSSVCEGGTPHTPPEGPPGEGGSAGSGHS